MLPTTSRTVANYEGRISSYTEWAFGSQAAEAAKARDALTSQLSTSFPDTTALRIADIGCGPGRDMLQFLSLRDDIEVTGIEPSPAFCNGAQEQLNKQHEQTRYSIMQSDICDSALVQRLVGIEDNTTQYHGAFCLCSLFHIPTSQLHGALRNIHSLLQPRGVLFTTFPLNSTGSSVISTVLSALGICGCTSTNSNTDEAISEGEAMPDGRWCTALTVDEHRRLLVMNGFRPLKEVVVRIYNGVWTGIVSEKIDKGSGAE